MMKFRFLALGLGLGMSGAMAQPATTLDKGCLPLANIVQEHADRFNEYPIFYGTTQEGGMIVFSQKDGSTWTVVQMNLEQDKGCIISAGKNLKEIVIVPGQDI